MRAYDIVALAGIIILAAGVLALVAILRPLFGGSGPAQPSRPWCANCGHLPGEHGRGGKCWVAVGGSGDRYDGGGNWIGFWNETTCDCSGYRESRRG
ncbi:hypothetical protein P8605_16370 [Streptomyces sp. T-3]|nr:hypothetical protein [Streptomyces sp. T-3]